MNEKCEWVFFFWTQCSFNHYSRHVSHQLTTDPHWSHHRRLRLWGFGMGVLAARQYGIIQCLALTVTGRNYLSVTSNESSWLYWTGTGEFTWKHLIHLKLIILKYNHHQDASFWRESFVLTYTISRTFPLSEAVQSDVLTQKCRSATPAVCL